MNHKLRYYSYFVSFSVLLLILKGALVTSHNAGLSVPDWPTSYGDNMFLFPPSKWVGTIFYEHVHRLLASFVGLLTVILTFWIFRVEKRKWVKILSLCALFAVILQGLLGGITVRYQLPPAVSSAHAVLAQTFFILTIIIAYSQSAEFDRRKLIVQKKDSSPEFRLSLILIAVVFVQLIIGAFMRHTESGLAVPDFPTVGGEYLPKLDNQFLSTINRERKELSLPEVNAFQVGIHLTHRVFALLVFAAFLPLGLSVWKHILNDEFWLMRAKKLTGIIGCIIVAQATLGIFTLLSLRDPWIASFHVMLGALLLGLSTLLALRLYNPKGKVAL
jgi:cytochrome c oxidase assembly protein subunit 15